MTQLPDKYKALQDKANNQSKVKPQQHESKLQIACVTWFKFSYPKMLLFSVPNGGSRNKAEASRLKQEGVMPGVSDLILFYPNNGYHALCIEMKYKDGKQSDHQKLFEKRVKALNYKYIVVNSFDMFRAEITEYLKEK